MEVADGIAVAFVGRQIDRKVDGLAALLTFEVDRVYKGEAGPLVEVHTPISGGACGADFGRRGTTAVVARLQETDYPHLGRRAGDLMVGTLSDRFSEAEFKEVFGTGYPPDETLLIAEEADRSTSTNPEQSASSATTLQLAYVGIALVVISEGLIAIRLRYATGSGHFPQSRTRMR